MQAGQPVAAHFPHLASAVGDTRFSGVDDAIEALGQRRAGLTLVLLGGNEESPDRRLVIWAVPTEPDTREEEGR